MFCVARSHDNYVTAKDGSFQPVAGSNYASQRTVFDDLGQGVLHNAFEGQQLMECLWNFFFKMWLFENQNNYQFQTRPIFTEEGSLRNTHVHRNVVTRK